MPEFLVLEVVRSDLHRAARGLELTADSFEIADHTPPRPITPDQARVKAQPADTRPRAKWPSFQPAQVAQYSPGAHRAERRGGRSLMRRRSTPPPKVARRTEGI